ncbi:MAG: ABC transporter ATP-binding protein [Planctomycetes bacterium]|nr:ABC transporter ATP-binding protein [Planctomycetota bacterium]
MTAQDTTLQEEEYQGRLSLPVWKKLFAYARPYRGHLAGLCATAAVLAVLEAVMPMLSRGVIDAADQARHDLLRLYVLGYAVVVPLFCTCIFAFIRMAARISTGISHDIRKDGFDHLQTLSFSFYDRRAAGWLVARLTGDCDRMSRTLAWGTLDVVWGTGMIIALTAVMLSWNVTLALVVLSTLPVIAWVSMVFQPRILRASRAIRKQNSTITAAYSECISGVRTTKTLVREDENLREFAGKTAGMFDASMHNAVLSAAYFPILMTIGSTGAGLVLWAGGVRVIGGALSIGTLVQFMNSAIMLIFPILEMSRVFADLPNTQAAAERVFGLIDTDPAVKDTPQALAAIAAHRTGGETAGDLAGDGMDRQIRRIEFRDVSFAYLEGKTVLDRFNLTVEPGQTVALVGPTGGGKSTIVNLLCRFYEPTDGQILIDGIEYRDRSLHWLQSNLGIVLQQPHLFSGTVRENIRYGKLDADDAQIERAARLVHAHDFIANLADGYDTDVGEGGNNLSTGQKQLVSFARAVLADPQIFVMDEATSSVDTETEKAIQNGLQAVLQGRISFIIAHRLSTIRQADVICVIDDGRILEQGDHRQLIARRGRYYELYTSQFTEEQTARLLSAGDD